MRSNSGLERFQRPRVSHSNLSAANFRADIGINPLKQLRPVGSIKNSPSRSTGILGRIDRRFQSRKISALGKSRRLAKIENKIVVVPARVWFSVDFESIVRRKTHNAFVGSGCRKNVLVLCKRK